MWCYDPLQSWHKSVNLDSPRFCIDNHLHRMQCSVSRLTNLSTKHFQSEPSTEIFQVLITSILQFSHLTTMMPSIRTISSLFDAEWIGTTFTLINLLFAASGLIAINGPVLYATDIEFGDQHATRIGVSFWIIVDLSIPSFDHTLMIPSSPAVRRPVPSGLQRAAFIDPMCAFMIRSARALRFNMMKRPSLLHINSNSFDLLSLELPGPLDLLDARLPHSHCKSVG